MLPTLSICIPTYERPHMLLPYLKEIDKAGFLPFSFEVIVIDNASEKSDYSEVAQFKPSHYQFSFLCRTENIGAFRNVMSSMRMARGAFCLYLGDDDRVIAEGLAAAVVEMQADPAIMAVYASFDEVDLVRDQRAGPPPFERAIFSRHAAAGMVAAFSGRELLPEIGLYRTDALAKALLPNKAIYFGHLLVERLLRFGSMLLSDKPFYEFVRGCVDEPYPRRTLGWRLPLSSFDQIARGTALFHRRFAAEKGVSRPLEGLDRDQAVWEGRAFECAKANERYLEACELGMLFNDLLAYHSPGRTLKDATDLGDLLQCAACEAAGLLAADVPGIKQIGLYNFDAVELSIFARVVFRMDIAKSVEIRAHELADPSDDTRLIVTVTADDRRAIVAAGQSRPGLVISLEELQAVLDV